MGEITFDPLQKIIVQEITSDPYLRKNFYFTGETALSVFYLHHRLSEDLDFFTENEFLPERVIDFMNHCAKKYHFSLLLREVEETNILIFSLDFGKKGKLKVDFNYYPYKRVKPSKVVNKLSVDSLYDIATNKLLSVNQKTDVKDFVDLYFLLKKFTIWDLMYGVEAKFGMELELVMIASDFLKVEEFDFLPKMLVPLTNKELIDSFKKQAIEIGKRITK